ncbi:MAG: VWA domain-containing protein [Methylococcaceae bacterium]|nr:VWA domain-containing protein [Methylococcaceae bacterium]
MKSSAIVEKLRTPVLYAAFLLIVSAIGMRPIPRFGDSFEHIFVVDITRSMNVQDYKIDSRATARLDFAKQALVRAVRDLPCGSRAGLGVFTERRSTLLFTPIEICQGYGEIVEAIDHLHWAMAWAADSRVAKGFHSALELVRDFDANLIFLTDGHESPPLNPRYATSFQEFKGKIKGLIIGAGGLTPAPIPKFDSRGKPIGFYSAGDVPHRSNYGLSHLDPSEIQGYDPRNAPFGSEQVTGNEHLSALRESYLKQLAVQSGFDYHRLTSFEKFSEATRAPSLARIRTVPVDFAWLAASAALGLLILSYSVGAYLER